MANLHNLQIVRDSVEYRPKLGSLLLQSGVISRERLDVSLAEQISSRTQSRLGEILLADNSVDSDALLKALARQHGLGRVDLQKYPPDPELLARVDPLACLKLGFLPWRVIGDFTIVALSDPTKERDVISSLRLKTPKVALTLTKQSVVHEIVHREFVDLLSHRASYLCPAHHSCRTLQSSGTISRLLLFIAALAGLACIAPTTVMSLVLSVIAVANFGTAILRLLAFGAAVLPNQATISEMTNKLSNHRPLPKISILVPLFRETKVLDTLFNALNLLDYPRSLLDIKLVLEADDAATCLQLLGHDLPNWIETVVVPSGTIQTKPRAMNFALPFCKGDVVGIYDAEDRPEPDQLRKVALLLANSPRNVACVQGVLDFYNTRQNWISRCFAIEYAQWFRVLLPGLQRLNVPLPLGGTTVFFRRDVLEKIGGWDAHNVTEDADLGMRLARFGYRCVMLDSTTFEESTCQSRAWIRQRSRWLKGYALTWASHMRRPGDLLDDLGLAGFLAFQALFVGTIVGHLAFPVHLLLWAKLLGLNISLPSAIPPAVWFWFATSHLVGLTGLVLVTVRALLPKSRRHLDLAALTMPFYWPFGALACWRACLEAVFSPFYWAKTEHGLSDTDLS